jgi:hypothetical protein
LLEGSARLMLTGETAAAYRLDFSEDLSLWSELTTLTNAFGATEFTDTTATNRPHRFYRAVSVP